MSIQFASINSGSNGNCYYVGNNNEAVLVDVGINCREIEKRMKRLVLDVSKIKAIFITHEHTDHVRGLSVFARKYNLPVYISPGTLNKCHGDLGRVFTKPIQHEQEVSIGELVVVPFKKIHDAADPYSFTISNEGYTVGVITDIGMACENVVKHFKTCHAVFLEANYDVEMLNNGRYPYYLKQRIRGGEGHISNDEALELFQQHKSANLEFLILSHLSQENNSPDLVQNIFNAYEGDTTCIVASRYQETGVFIPRVTNVESVKEEQIKLVF